MKQSSLLLLIAGLLLVVGFVSHSILRHLIQIVPIVTAVFLLQQKQNWASAFSAAIGLFWLVIMVLIWLFLLGISNITKGHFSFTEIVMTFIIGLASIVLLKNSLKKVGNLSVIAAVAGFMGGLALQVFFMWLSMGDKKF